MRDSRSLLCPLLIVTTLCIVPGCGESQPPDATGDDTGETDATTSAATSGSPAGDVDPTLNTTDSGSTGPTGPLDDGETGDGDSGSGSDDGCGADCEVDPHVVWIAEPFEELLGGGCREVISDGQGGAVASFDTNPESPLGGGLVLALDEDGITTASRTLEQREVSGMHRTGPGSFRWADSWAGVGDDDTGLTALDGEWLATDLVAIDDLAPMAGGYAYASVVGGIFPDCRIRIDNGVFVDSPPLPCGGYASRWQLRPTAEGSMVAGLTGESALAHVTASGELVAWVDWRFQRTMLDLAVDPMGRVWTVGIVRDPNAAGPSYGAFVARHGPGIAARPEWEVVDDSDASLAWTAIVMWQGAPILVGRDADDRGWLLGLTETGDAAWELEFEFPPSVILRQADLDDAGRLLLCGDEIEGDLPAKSSHPVLARVDLGGPG